MNNSIAHIFYFYFDVGSFIRGFLQMIRYKEIDINPGIISGSRPIAVDALIALQPIP